MSSAPLIACPQCGAAPGKLCRTKSGEFMSIGHASRTYVSILPDGEIGALEPDDPDEKIAPLGDIGAPQLDLTKDRYPDRAVLRWSRTYINDKTYIYAAIKATGIGWFMTGKTQDAIPWDVLWNKHLMKADWVEYANRWDDVHIIHDPKGTT
jgi:hypothetical protein